MYIDELNYYSLTSMDYAFAYAPAIYGPRIFQNLSTVFNINTPKKKRRKKKKRQSTHHSGLRSTHGPMDLAGA